jgi:hypothetical protein
VIRQWIGYTGVSVLVLLIAVVVALLLAPAHAMPSVWLAAGVALAVQMLAFGLIIAPRRDSPAFLAGWLGGVGLRFATVLAVALTVGRAELFDASTTLLSLVAFVFLLLLVEPVFLQRTLRTR